MAKAKKITIWALVIVAIIAGIFWKIKSKKPVTVYTTADAEKTLLAQTVSVTGDLVANEEITLNFEIGGRVSKVFVKESDRVAAGDMIATLTDSTLQKQVEGARSALNQAIGNAGTNNDTLREAKVTEENAENVLRKTKNLNDENVSAAKQAVDNAQRYYDNAKNLLGGSSADTLAITAARNSLEATKKALDVAEQQAELSKTNAENSVEFVLCPIQS
jgi:membrane fusion protein (multidrug efflux system)